MFISNHVDDKIASHKMSSVAMKHVIKVWPYFLQEEFVIPSKNCEKYGPF